MRCDQMIANQGPEWWEARRKFDTDAYRLLLSRIEVRGPTLEIGAGDGWARRLLEGMGFAPLTGLDLLIESVWQARAAGMMAVECGPMESMPFEDGQFAVVVSRHSLEHTFDPIATVNEIARVLRPKGVTAHAIPCSSWAWSEPAHCCKWGYFEWRAAFEGAGFKAGPASIYRDYTRSLDAECHMMFTLGGVNGRA